LQRSKTAFWTVAACIAWSLICGPNVSAQEHQEALRGTVRDAVGAVPAAEVTLVNEDSKVERIAMTDERGEYGFTEIMAGTYTVRVSLPGFAVEERKGLRLDTRRALAVDVMLDPGELSEQTVLTSWSCRDLFFLLAGR
jgi:hypothetical protein